MNVIIEAPFVMNEEQELEIKTQVEALSKYHSKITNAEVYFKTGDGTTSNSILAEVQLHVPGPVIFASDIAPQFLDAFSGALKKAKIQLLKAKDIRQGH
jgi:ribosome-associated translation inhibitor RaiA